MPPSGSIVSLFQLFRGPDEDFKSCGIVRQVRILRQVQTDGLGHRVLFDLEFTALDNVRQVMNFASVDMLLGNRVKAVTFQQEVVETSWPRRACDSKRLVTTFEFRWTCDGRRSVNAFGTVDDRSAGDARFGLLTTRFHRGVPVGEAI